MLPWSAPSELRKYSAAAHKMTGIPALPEPAHPDLDSMLSRKFGKEVANYFSGEKKKKASDELRFQYRQER